MKVPTDPFVAVNYGYGSDGSAQDPHPGHLRTAARPHDTAEEVRDPTS